MFSACPKLLPERIEPAITRRRFRLRGQLQGVGFRPFVHRLAQQQRLSGWVLNDASGVTLEVQGTVGQLEAFARSLVQSPPPLAQIESWHSELVAVIAGERAFAIHASEPKSATHDAAVTVDTAVCHDCLGELLNPQDRRKGHPFINCTNCGPRFSIVRDIPYDRPNTTMAGFEMCGPCSTEYGNPADRRFHAQPVCCRKCGPTLRLVTPLGKRIRRNAIEETARLLALGKIVAIKGIGGFHLAVRADCAAAVERLRALKQRDSKPFALMVPSLAAARRLVNLSPAGEAALFSAAAPIVLAVRQEEADKKVVAAVASGTDLLGVMLPYTPVHHLLFKALATRCSPLEAPPALVMTSGNTCSEPLAIDDRDAMERLGPLCDALLLHNRAIERCVDDSVLVDRGAMQKPMPIRRSRGFAPGGWTIPETFSGHATGICVGGELKNTLALVRGRDLVLSQHLGDLSHPLAYEHFQKAAADLTRLFDVPVQFVAHDLHPDYASTRFARELARRHRARLIAVQHHAAHAYGVLGEHGVREALALICDGTGYGLDGSAWGGELLHVQGSAWNRVGSLRPFRLPGGDAAARDPRRCGLALLHMAYGDDFENLAAAQRLFADADERQTLAHMIRRGLNSPWTTSTGRLFDGVAALLGICQKNGHEAEAAMALEAASRRAPADRPPGSDGHFALHQAASGWQLDLAAFVRRIVQAKGEDVACLAAEFHLTLADGFMAMVKAAGHPELPLAISGGTFCNQVLTTHFSRLTATQSRRLLLPTLYPPTDGGLSFGQAIYALHVGAGGAA